MLGADLAGVAVCRTYTMWLPKSDKAQYPMPELITPVWGPDGALTHYIIMFGGFKLKQQEAEGKPRLTCWQHMSTVPAHITILSYLRYELAADVGKIRQPQQHKARVCKGTHQGQCSSADGGCSAG